MKKLLLGISAGALMLATAGFAAEAGMGGHMGHTMTRAEAQTAAEMAFAKLDLNHDGKLDAADRAARLGMMFDKIDTNKDGTISRDEFIAAHEKMRHVRMGMGMGGMGMGGERPNGPPPPREGREAHEGHEGHEGGPGHRMMGHDREKMAILMAILHEADPAHTGTITREAFVGAALKLFDKADTNHDGKVTPEEHHAAMAKGREQMRKMMREHMGPDGMKMDGMKMGGMDHDHMGDMPAPAPAK